VTDRPASGSGAKSDVAAEAWDLMNESALATIQMSVKPVHLYTVTAVSTAKEAWDALKDIFEARDNARLLQLMHELRNLKKGHMKRDCLKKKADDAKGNKKPNGGRREGGCGGGAPPRAALAYAASAGQAGKRNASGSSSGSSTWVLDSGATNHMAAQDAGFTVKTTGSGAKVTFS